MKNEELAPQKEMTLDEWVSRLAPSHRVHEELKALKRDSDMLSALNGETIMKTKYGGSWYKFGDDRICVTPEEGDGDANLTTEDLLAMIRELDPRLADTIEMTQRDIQVLINLLKENPE